MLLTGQLLSLRAPDRTLKITRRWSRTRELRSRVSVGLAVSSVPIRYQIVMDVHDPALQVRFWSAAQEYQPEPPPAGFARWSEYWKRMGMPESDQIDVPESISDPRGHGPRIWFHAVPEPKVSKNRLHLDIRVSGGMGTPLETRKERVEAEAARLVRLGATRLEALEEPGVEHYAVAMLDPEGNEFDIN